MIVKFEFLSKRQTEHSSPSPKSLDFLRAQSPPLLSLSLRQSSARWPSTATCSSTHAPQSQRGGCISCTRAALPPFAPPPPPVLPPAAPPRPAAVCAAAAAAAMTMPRTRSGFARRSASELRADAAPRTTNVARAAPHARSSPASSSWGSSAAAAVAAAAAPAAPPPPSPSSALAQAPAAAAPAALALPEQPPTAGVGGGGGEE